VGPFPHSHVKPEKLLIDTYIHTYIFLCGCTTQNRASEL
jgi:hypothetical protein